jgi:penicillin-binding protein 1C
VICAGSLSRFAERIRRWILVPLRGRLSGLRFPGFKAFFRPRRFLSRKALILSLSGALLFAFAFCLPDPLFDDPYSPVLLDRNGEFLGALVASDGQWRFPPSDWVNEKFAAALIEFEDKRFRFHPGVDPLAVGRALYLNIRAGRVVSGGSTITMQTIRLSRRGKRRTFPEKAVEAILAFRLELGYSKDQILRFYANNAPFGGNVVGIGAASWRWFGRSAGDLSWAEAATLAALPNGPGLVHPGRNREALKKKRDALLERLWKKGRFDRETLELAWSEPLPDEPLPLPRPAPHLLERLVAENGGKEKGRPMETSLDREIQERLNGVLRRHSEKFAGQGILNAACLVLDTKTGETLAYIGNVESRGDAFQEEDGTAIDMITVPRSSGSILKPFLYAAMLDSGGLSPVSLVSDIPTRVGAYSPENISGAYLGALPASEALARSLNIPAIRSLRNYGVVRFASLLRSLGLSTLFRRAEDYGLPLILGGAEVKLWEMAGLYASLARTALFPGETDSLFFPPRLSVPDPPESSLPASSSPGEGRGTGSLIRQISPGAAYLTLSALTFTARPGEESAWQEYAGARRIAWKTGTSFGNRDAWAIGVTGDLTVAVWAGNATGEGRPSLRSAETSAPLLFEVFSALDGGRSAGEWFPLPEGSLESLELCAASGYPAGPDCGEISRHFVPAKAPAMKPCPYCVSVTLNQEGTARVTLDPGSSKQVQNVKWFVLPPAEEWYYRKWNFDYRPLPPLEGEEDLNAGGHPMALFNPEEGSRIYVPVELDGEEGRIVFIAAHRDSEAEIHWHLDDEYLGKTRVFHELEARPREGRHTLTLIDSAGLRLVRRFETLGRNTP